MVRRTLYDLYCLYSSLEVMVKFTRRAMGHFVTLIEYGMHLISCISGHNIDSRMSAQFMFIAANDQLLFLA